MKENNCCFTQPVLPVEIYKTITYAHLSNYALFTGIPLSCQSVLGYSTALGVVSVLLIISLVGYVVYTVVMCVLVRKGKHHSANREK